MGAILKQELAIALRAGSGVGLGLACCRIIVLQDGEKREEGTHDELIAAQGMYAGLYSLHYASFDDVSDDVADGLADAGSST